MTSAMPRMAAASRSSRVRTTPRSPSGTSAASLIDPASPRDAHIRITRTPASASRASVPPHASDSSSGCAKTARTVRPASAASDRPAAGTALSATMLFHDALVDADVLVDHPRDAEALDCAIAHAAAIQIEDARKLVRHLLQVVEDHAGHPLVHDLAHGAAIERGDGRAARHRFGEDEPERLARLNRVEQRARAAVQLHLRVEVRFAEVHDAPAVDVTRDVLAIILFFRSRQNQ